MTTILLGMALACAAAYPFMPVGRRTALRAIVKTVPVSLFAMMAAIAGAPVLLVAALVHSAVGDLLLAFARPADDHTDRPDIAFLAGLMAFLAGHVIYVLLFMQTRFGDPPPYAWLIATLMVAFALTMGGILFRHAGPLRWPVMAYVATILAMGLTALTTGSWLILAGAVLFMASDAILGIERFVIESDDGGTRAATGPAIWVLYIAAQLALLSAFL